MRRFVLVWFLAFCFARLLAAAAGDAAEQVFGDRPIRHFQIEVTGAELSKLTKNNRSYARATLTIDGASFTEVGLRLKGEGSFRPVDQKPSFAVKFNQFKQGQKFHGLTKIMLNNSSQDSTYLSEYVATGLFRDAGVPAARVTHARVSLNGRELGFYVLIEAMNKAFLKEHFSDPSGNLYEGYARDIDQKLEQDGGVPSDQTDLRELVSAARLAASERMPRLQELLDVERFYSFLVISTFIAQHDSYQYNRNNYRIYHDPKSGRFVMIPHGIDGSFTYNSVSIRPPAKYILARALLDTDDGQKHYRETCENLFRKVFKLDVATNRMAAATKRLLAAALSDQERARISSGAAAFLRRVVQRYESVSKQLGEPDPRRLAITEGQTISLTDWRASIDAGTALTERRTLDDHPVLYLRTNGDTGTAAWRARAQLEAGRYRFVGRLRTLGVTPTRASTTGLSPANSIGASLRTFKMYVPAKRIIANGEWKSLEHPFAVLPGEEEVEFICDLRANDGEAWFDYDSLQLVREK